MRRNPVAKAQVPRSLLLEHRRRQAERLELAQAMARQNKLSDLERPRA